MCLHLQIKYQLKCMYITRYSKDRSNIMSQKCQFLLLFHWWVILICRKQVKMVRNFCVFHFNAVNIYEQRDRMCAYVLENSECRSHKKCKTRENSLFCVPIGILFKFIKYCMSLLERFIMINFCGALFFVFCIISG